VRITVVSASAERQPLAPGSGAPDAHLVAKDLLRSVQTGAPPTETTQLISRTGDLRRPEHHWATM